MKELKFKHHKSGVVSVVINTPKRWMDYEVCINFKRDENNKPIKDEYQMVVYLKGPEYEVWSRGQLFAEIDLDFEYLKYHRLDEVEKDQIVVYFIPKEMLL